MRLLGLGLGIARHGTGAGGFVSVADHSVVTWDSGADTYTQTIFQVNQSKVTWDAGADTYTQTIFDISLIDDSVVTWNFATDTYTQELYTP